MPRFTDEAVCIRHWDFSETSQTVSLFGREHGIIRGLAKGSKREKSRFSGGIELLTRGQITAITKESRELATLTEWDLEEIFPALQRSLSAWYAGMYFADLVQHFMQEGDAHPALFDALVHALRSLSSDEGRGKGEGEGDGLGEARVQLTTLEFQWAILCEGGFQPTLERDAETNEPLLNERGKLRSRTLAFSAKHGGTVHDTGGHDRWRARAETIDLLRDIDRAWSSKHRNGDGDTDRGESTIADPFADESKLVDRKRDTIDRANKLLAAYIRTILDRELATMRHAIGRIRL